ncbi:hypothetical protein M9Y10_001510 [Tritrichomonas musculus]|uniref:DUF3447 domain-containing protein n=1 Tax=Tritrichomonas musculus TaxID=1915356 RepID=A0ABR2L881_9EUKA
MSTSFSEYLDNIKNIQEKILIFIENENDKEENYQNLLQLIDDDQILCSPSKTKLILMMISKILDNHYRLPNFFNKIELILLFLNDSMTTKFSNNDYFTMFSNNKRILLFLLKEGIIKIDINIFNNLIENEKSFYNKTSPNLKYFLPEIKFFINKQKDSIIKKENNEKLFFEDKEKTNFVNINELREHINQVYQAIVNDEYEEKRNRGENDDYLCQIIRQDSIEEFITEYKKRGFSLEMEIPASFFETNSFLLKNRPTLIEYASFFGSSQIFRFLIQNEVELTSSLWLYAIHSDNSEMISILEEKCPKPESFKESWIEAIKCHHNSMANYLENNYSIETCYKFFSFFNISILANNNVNREVILYYSCKYDYFDLCKILLNTTKVNINCFKSTWIDEIETINISTRTVNYEIKRRLISEKTPFAVACQNSNIDIINLLLLDNKIDINLPNFYFDERKAIQIKIPLYLAVENNKSDVVKILLLRPEIDINFHRISEKVSQTSLCKAVELQNIEIIKLLLSHPEIDVNLPEESENKSQTALYLAVELQNIEIIKLLLSHPKINVNKECNALFDYLLSQQIPFSLAVGLGRPDIVELFLENCDIDFKKKSLFSLLKSSLFGSEKKTLLYFAIENENLEVVKVLLKNEDIDINELNDIYRNTKGIFYYDTERSGRSIDYILYKCKKAALHIAVQKKLFKYVELLLSNPRTDVNILCESFKEYWSSGSTDYEADFNDVDFYYINPKDDIEMSSAALHMAVDNNDTEIVKLLLSHPNIDVNILSKSKNVSETALHRAVYKGNEEIIELLLSHPKIDVNIPTKDSKSYTNGNKTALHIAYQKEKTKIIKLLLQRNDINVDALDNNQKKPSDYCFRY